MNISLNELFHPARPASCVQIKRAKPREEHQDSSPRAFLLVLRARDGDFNAPSKRKIHARTRSRADSFTLSNGHTHTDNISTLQVLIRRYTKFDEKRRQRRMVDLRYLMNSPWGNMGRTYTQSCLQNAVETAQTHQTRLSKTTSRFDRRARAWPTCSV